MKASRLFHGTALPVLVSSQLLRSRNLGQLDLLRLARDRDGWILEVTEVKSSTTGTEALERGQKKRIHHSMRFLAALFGARTRLTGLVG